MERYGTDKSYGNDYHVCATHAFAHYFDSTLFSQVQIVMLVKGWKC